MKLSEYLKIGTKMKILRKEKGISQKEMAEILGMIPSAYSNYENHFTDIPVEIMKKFCNIVGCSMNELIGFDVSTSEEVHPIFSISDLMLVIMDLNKKKLPVSVTFRSEGEILTFNKDNTYTEKGENDTQNDTFEYFPNRYMFVTYYTTDWGEENTIYTVVKITKDELYLNNNENFKINWNDLINGHVGCKLYSMQ